MRRVRPVLAAMLALLAACGRGEHARSGGGEDPWPQPAPAMRLTQDDGSTFDLAAQAGNVVVLFFGYTHCPDVCPTTLADFASVKRELGPRAERVRWVFVSVDWGRDTEAAAMSYARAFDPAFVGLAGDSAALAPVLRDFHVAAFREPTDSLGNYGVAHSAQVFVVDPAGRLHQPVGWSDDRVEVLRRAVEEALEGS